MRERYARMTGKEARSRLIDEYVAVTGFERKYGIKVLGGKRRRSKPGARRRGSPRRYGQAVDESLRRMWLAMDQPCGKRMKDMLPIWIGHSGEKPALRERLSAMSAATIDRHLAGAKVNGPKKRLPPRGDAAVKAQVEIRAESWERKEVGWTEVDTVAHCGGSLLGDFIWCLTSTEICSGWTEVRALWNRGQLAAVQGLIEIESAQPFALRGVDSDNGGEFINHHLHGWLKGRNIKQTRSRPYYKNDQAYVEQKNYTHVRELLGYERLGFEELQAPLNELLALWSLWKNLFCVTMEQISKTREGSKQVRRHAKKNRTPAQRLIESGQIEAGEKKRIIREQRSRNPFAMKAEIEHRLRELWAANKRLLETENKKRRLAASEPPPLRSGGSLAAKKTNQHQAVTVSAL